MSELLCELCPKSCRIPEGMAGDCRIRVNLDGKLVATTFGRPAAVHIDPMEKKPFYHFHPGCRVFSIATAGCNLHCKNCQNWQLSQSAGYETDNYDLPPEAVVAAAKQSGCPAIAYTYSEPLVYYEYTLETATLARRAGLWNVLVTAGYINKKPLRRLCKAIDASTTDLKFFDDALYGQVCDASLKPILDGLVTCREEGLWVEVSNLLVPTLADDFAMIGRMCRWIAGELGPETPLHFLRFYPQYQLRNLPPTPAATLVRARQIAFDAGLKHVYAGNLRGDVEGAEDTRCAGCGKTILRRIDFEITEMDIQGGRCKYCGRRVAGVWSEPSGGAQ